MEWRIEKSCVEYSDALEFMKKRVAKIVNLKKEELIWMLEHHPVYTAGSSAKKCDLINKDKLPVFNVGRGGQYTYHGPGQRIVYILIDLKKRNLCDLKQYIYNLEEIIIQTLKKINIQALRKKDYIGIWVEKDCQEKKIAAIGVRITKWITYHGIAVNINPNLCHYGGIVPCGVKDFGVTSLKDMGYNISTEDFDSYFKQSFKEIFNIK